MAQTGAAYGDALADAKRLGYAEPDPTFDVEGFDTAHKIAILASLAFGQDIRFDDVHVEGISGVRADDLADAKENGLALKLVATAQRDDATSPVEVHVHPTLLPRGSGLGSVDGVINAVEFVGNAVGTVMLTGPGAGPAPTASAVLSDVMNLAQQIADGGLSLDSRLRVPVGVKSLCTFEDVETVHRVRARLTGDAAAPSQVRDAFAAEKVGVRELSESGHRVLTLITERAPEKRVQAVLKRLEALPCIAEAPASLRLEEKP
jgi:homoserine dehydrogenase